MFSPFGNAEGAEPLWLCNRLLESERLTDDLYKLALERVRDERLSCRLTSIRLNHLEAILLLKRAILELGGEPTIELAASKEAERIYELRRDKDYDSRIVPMLLEMERGRAEQLQAAAERFEEGSFSRRTLEEELLPRAAGNQRSLERMAAEQAHRARREEQETREGSLLLGSDDAAPFSVI